MTTPDIFLSYSREDQAVAARFADAFSAEGLRMQDMSLVSPSPGFRHRRASRGRLAGCGAWPRLRR